MIWRIVHFTVLSGMLAVLLLSWQTFEWQRKEAKRAQRKAATREYRQRARTLVLQTRRATMDELRALDEVLWEAA